MGIYDQEVPDRLQLPRRGDRRADGTSMYLRYEGTISGSDSAHALTAGVRMSW